MKVNESTRFPHPVLSAVTGDYLNVEFALKINVTERPKTGKLELHYEETVSEEGIAELLRDKKASLGIFVTCLETFFNKLVVLDSADRHLEFAPGVLKGRVILRPVIWANTQISSFSSAAMHSDFSGIKWNFQKGAILALGQEQIIHAGQDKLAPMETIFSLAKANDLKEGEFRIGLDADKISIYTAPATYNKAHILRGTTEGKVLLLNGLYFPVIMEVLLSLRDGGAGYESKRWYKIFHAKCMHMNINTDATEVFESAQKLLKYPFNRIHVGEDH